VKIRLFGSGVVPCGQEDRQTDMMKLIFASRNIANALKKEIGIKGYGMKARG